MLAAEIVEDLHAALEAFRLSPGSSSVRLIPHEVPRGGMTQYGSQGLSGCSGSVEGYCFPDLPGGRRGRFYTPLAAASDGSDTF